MEVRTSRASVWSACLGNLFEHYDTALFGFLSPFIAPQIFPQQDPLTALILTYAMIPLGMLARPLGSLVFGWIGDRYGRKQALILTLFGMALVSLAMAVSPTFANVGVVAPLIFCAGRLIQNFLASGENMGGAIFLLENSTADKRDFMSSLYNASTMGGILLASAGVSILSYLNIIDWGWRLLYLFGTCTAVFGCILRRGLSDDLPSKTSNTSFFRIAAVFWQQRKALASIAVVAGFGYACYSMALVLLNGFIPLISSVTKSEMSSVNTSLLILDFCALPIFGWVSSKMTREKLMLTSALLIAVVGVPACLLLEGAFLVTAVAIRIGFVLLGVAFFAPFHAWAQELVPPAHRYLIVSFGYALGSQLLGGPTAAISLWLFQQTGLVASVAWYWVFLALASSAVIYATKREMRSANCKI